MDRFIFRLAPPTHIFLRGGAVAVLVMGMLTWGVVCAQPLQTHLPHLHNEAAGTGAVGSEITGVMNGGEGPRPAIASAIPTAYGAEFGDLFWGVGYQHYLAPSIPERNDGAAFLGVGVGDPTETVGLEITHATYDLVEEPFSDGSLSLKVHRRLYGGLAIAVGVESGVRYGNWAATSAYAVASQTVQIENEFLTGVSATVGVGDGRFNTMSNLSEGTNQAGLFGGLSIQLVDRASVLGTWYGQDLNLGLSVVVPGPLPITLTPVWVSVLDRHVSGDRFALSIGTSYQFR